MKDKVVLITGASRGIGRATAIEFAKRGANIIINYKENTKATEELKKHLISEYGARAITIRTDISIEAEVESMIDIVMAEFGHIDFLINNAGIANDKEFSDRTIADWQKTFSTNLFGAFIVSKYVGEIMMDNKFGKIVNLSSTSGMRDFSPYAIDYNASKAGMISLTKSLAIQFSPYINVNAVAPGWVDTDMNKGLPADYMADEVEKIALGRIAKPDEIAKAIVFLCSDDASYVNGTVLEVHGGHL